MDEPVVTIARTADTETDTEFAAALTPVLFALGRGLTLVDSATMALFRSRQFCHARVM